jgi:glycosyltransferase involved in cell wall biosynthesis
MPVAKTLLFDLSHLHNRGEESNKRKVFHYGEFHSPDIVRGWQPTHKQIHDFLDGLTHLYSAETVYSPQFIDIAKSYGVKVIVHANPEFCDNIEDPGAPMPDLIALPTEWLYDRIPSPKLLLPVPVATERFTESGVHRAPTARFLHVIGRPAAFDRNGTIDLLRALRYIKSDIRLTVRCIQTGYVDQLIRDHGIEIPRNVKLLIFDEDDVNEYWQLYSMQDVLVLPRRWGGMSLPLQEALGNGMPAIINQRDIYAGQLPEDWAVESTHVGSFKARTDIDWSVCNTEALAEKIDRFAQDETFCRDAQTYASQWAKANSWETLKPVYDRVFEC